MVSLSSTLSPPTISSISPDADHLPPDACRFMNLLPLPHRARCGDLFRKAADAGSASADVVLSSVCKTARARLGGLSRESASERADGYYQILLAVHQDMPGAKVYADFVLQWQRLPLDYRNAVRRARSQAARDAARIQVAA